MSEENVEIVLRVADAHTRRDVDALLAILSPDVEWEDPVWWTESMRVYKGHQEVREWFERALVEPWESFRVEAEEVIPVGDDRVVAGGFVRGRGRGSGVETEVRGWLVFWIEDGLITRRCLFRDRAEALEAAGLSE